MPKVKPDNVVRHEIVLGRSERELLDTVTTAYTVNRVVSPITGLLSSAAGLLLVLGIGLAYIEQYLPEDWQDRTDASLRDWFEAENILVGSIGFGLGGIVGALFGGPIGAGLGATGGSIFGTVVQEGAEEAQAAGVPKLLSYSAFGQLVGAARLLKGTIDELQNQ